MYNNNLLLVLLYFYSLKLCSLSPSEHIKLNQIKIRNATFVTSWTNYFPLISVNVYSWNHLILLSLDICYINYLLIQCYIFNSQINLYYIKGLYKNKPLLTSEQTVLVLKLLISKCLQGQRLYSQLHSKPITALRLLSLALSVSLSIWSCSCRRRRCWIFWKILET